MKISIATEQKSEILEIMKSSRNRYFLLYLFAVILFFNFPLYFRWEWNAKDPEDMDIYSPVPGKENPSSGIALTTKGLLFTYSYIKNMHDTLQTQEIPGEFLPERSLQILNKEYKKSLFLIIIIISITLLSFLYIISVHFSLSFSETFKTYLLLYLITVFSIDLFVFKKYNLFLYGNNSLSLTIIALETLFLFFATFFLFEKPRSFPDRKFLSFLQNEEKSIVERISDTVSFLYDFIKISFVSFLAVNLFLFPLFYLQIHLPFSFSYIVFIFFLVFAFYYLISYYRVSRQKEENPEWFFPALYFGYRILKNLLHFLLLLVTITALGLIISFILLMNSELFQILGIAVTSNRL